MKLLSLNVALFEANNELLKQFLHEQNADILCLQEVTRSLEKSTKQDFISKDAIDIATEGLYHFYGPNKVTEKFEQKNFHGKELFHFEFGGQLEFGNYTKSKYKITKAQNIFVQNCFTYTTDQSQWPQVDYRAVLVCDHEIAGKKLRTLNYHGLWTKNKLGNERTMTANSLILKLAREAEGEVIIAGDFNLFPDTPSMKLFERDFTSLVDTHKIRTTRPSSNELHDKERNVVDYILVSKGIKINNFQVIDSSVSDHLPLVLDFKL